MPHVATDISQWYDRVWRVQVDLWCRSNILKFSILAVVWCMLKTTTLVPRPGVGNGGDWNWGGLNIDPKWINHQPNYNIIQFLLGFYETMCSDGSCKMLCVWLIAMILTVERAFVIDPTQLAIIHHLQLHNQKELSPFLSMIDWLYLLIDPPPPPPTIYS